MRNSAMAVKHLKYHRPVVRGTLFFIGMRGVVIDPVIIRLHELFERRSGADPKPENNSIHRV